MTCLKVDWTEARSLTGPSDLQEAARGLAAYGPLEIVIAQSFGVTAYADGQFHHTPVSDAEALIVRHRAGEKS